MTFQDKSKEELMQELQDLQKENEALKVSYCQNLDERKLAEDALRINEENYRLLLELAPVAFFQGNETGNIIMANKKATLITGYTNEELLGMNLSMLFSSSILNLKPLRYDLLDKGEVVTLEREIRCKDHTTKTVEMSSRKMPNHTYQSFMRDVSEQKKIEAALSDSEHLYRTIFENTGTSSIIIEDDTTISLANTEWVNLAGYPREEMEGKMRWPEFIDPQDRERMIAYHKARRVDPNNAPRKYEFRFVRRNGEIRNMINCVAVIPESKKSIASLMDITELKQAEESLKEREMQLNTIIETSPDGVAITTMEGQIKFATQKVLSLWGYDSADEVMGKNVMDFVHPDYWEKARQSISKLVSGEQMGAEQFLMVRKDGNLFFCESDANILYDPNNVPFGILYINRDITQRKEAENELIKAKEKAEESEERLFAYINSIPDIICYKDGKGKWLLANESDLDLFCLKGVDYFGKTDLELSEYTHEIFRQSFLDCMNSDEAAWEKKALSNGIETIMTPSGEKKVYEVSKTPLFYPNGDRKGLAVIGRDITKLYETQEKLILAKEKAEESDRLKTSFLHNISHEIRTPMNAIVGFSEFLREPAIQPAKASQFADIIIQSSNQLLSIITDIISIATIEAGQEKIIEGEIELNATLKHLHAQFLINATKQNLALNLSPFPTERENWIISDETKLLQILTNLIVNALKFTKAGSVSFGYRIQGQELLFSVEDTGIGIPPEMHEEIFKRFRQVESTITRQFGGSGLGLSISKAYVELLGGKMWLESELGKGSTFYFSIPFKKGEKVMLFGNKFQMDHAFETCETKTLLIAEDEESNLSLLEAFLEDSNLAIVKANNGLEAVEICKSTQKIDLVLMDIKMPVMDGFEATKLIKTLRPELKVIAQTAYSEEIDKDKAYSAGCIDFICKPIKRELLLSKIKEHLGITE